MSNKVVSRILCLAGMLFLGGSLFLPHPAKACDTCNIFSAHQPGLLAERGPFAGVYEQFTRFNTLTFNGNEIANPYGQYLNSSITQIYAGYRITDRIGFQANFPLIAREWVRPQTTYLQKGSISGLGDISLVLRGQPFRFTDNEHDFVFAWDVEGGVKLPTGDTTELDRRAQGSCNSQAVFTPNPGARSKSPFKGVGQIANHVSGGSGVTCGNGVVNAITGSEITLGSGSYDGIFGTKLYVGLKRFYSHADFSYVVRTANDGGFEYEDDLIWRWTNGFYLVMNEGFSASLEGLIRGWWNEELYLGPGVNLMFGRYVSVNVSAELPVYYDAEGYELAPDYRVQSSLTLTLPL